MIVLVLGCDLIENGAKLGPKTELRLEEALQHLNEGRVDVLVVAASWSLLHAEQPASMAAMMADWLRGKGCKNEDVEVLEAETFNTRGELRAFFAAYGHEGAERLGVISVPWHLRRVRLLVWQEKGWSFMRSLQYLPVPKNKMTLKEKLFLEPVKILAEILLLFVPERYRDRIRDYGTSFVRHFVNTSW